MDAVTVIMIWGGGLSSGALITVGLVEALTGRLLFPYPKLNWQPGDAMRLGLSEVVLGVACALYDLVFGLVMTGAVPQFWIAWALLPIVILSGALLAFSGNIISKARSRTPTARPSRV